MQDTIEQTAEYVAMKQHLEAQAFDKDIRDKLILLQVLWFELSRMHKADTDPLYSDTLVFREVDASLNESLQIVIRALAISGDKWGSSFRYLRLVEQELHQKPKGKA